MSRSTFLAACALVVVGCDDDGDPTLADSGPSVDHGWDIQLVAPFDTTTQRSLLVLDLWDVAPMMSFDDNGTMIDIPAGPLANKIAELHAAGAEVGCRVDVGAIALDDPDAALFPGSTNPPDRPTDPDAASVVGWSVFPDDNTRYLDVRPAGYAMWKPLILARFDLAKQLGCDSVAVSRVDQVDSGFPLDGNDVTTIFGEMATEAKQRELAPALYTETMIGRVLGDGFANDYDFAITARCAEFDECTLLRDFELAGKKVFAYDFETDGTTDRDMDDRPDGVMIELACAQTGLPGDWILKDTDAVFRPSSAVRRECP